MKLGIFVNELRGQERLLERLTAEKVGVFLVGNGVYHAVIKKNEETSSLLQKPEINYYVLIEDLQTRGFTSSDVDIKVNVVTYEDVVELIMNDYDKLIWL